MDQTAAATERQYEFVDVSIERRVGVIRLNRPRQLNALNAGIMREIVEAGQAMDADPNVGCIVIAGSERAFSAGADITEMSDSSPGRLLSTNNIGRWDQIRRIGKPIIA